MKNTILLIVFLVSQIAFSQKVTYYNAQHEKVKKENASYYETISKTKDRTWKTQKFYISEVLKYEGYSLKKNGDKRIGTHYYYYSSGSLRGKKLYKDHKLAQREEFYKSSNLKERKIYRSDGEYEVVKSYYDSGQLKNDVIFSNTKKGRNIIAKSYYENGNLKRDDVYVKYSSQGEVKIDLVKGLCLSKSGIEIAHTPFMRMPEFPGGQEGLMTYLKRSIRYPPEAQRKSIQGRVYVSFVIDKTGKITDVRITESSDLWLDKEALRVVNNMPKWSAGFSLGEPVRVKYNLPINFKLPQ